MRRKTGGRGISSAEKCRRKFLRYFPGGFADDTYLDWERNYKWNAHLAWKQVLDHAAYRDLLRYEKHADVAAHAGEHGIQRRRRRRGLRLRVREPRSDASGRHCQGRHPKKLAARVIHGLTY